MPKTKLVRVVKEKQAKPVKVEEIEEMELEEELSEEEVEAGEKIAEFQAKFSGRAYRVRLEKFNIVESEWSWVTRLPLEGFDAFQILPKYGAGKYRAVLLDEGGRYVKGGMTEFRFDPPLEVPKDERQSALNDPAVIMALEGAKSQNLMLMEILKTFAPVQAAANQGAKPLDGPALMDMFAKFSTLTAPKESGVKSLVEMMGLIEKLKDSFAPDEEKGGILSELKEAIALLPVLREMAPQAGVVVPGQVVTNGPIRPVGPNPAPATQPGRTITTGMPVIMKKPVSPAAQKILFYVPKLEEAARENADPERWAEKVLDILDEEVIPALIKEYNGFVSEDSIYDRLLEGAKNGEQRESVFIHAPSLLPYKEWVYSVIDRAVAILETPDIAEAENGSAA